MVTLYERDDAVVAGVEKLRFFPLEVASGQGSCLVAPDGRELLDLSATWTAAGLGHGHPAGGEACAARCGMRAGRPVRRPPGCGGPRRGAPRVIPGSGERRVYSVTRGPMPTMSPSGPAGTPPGPAQGGVRAQLPRRYGCRDGLSGVHVEAGVPGTPMRLSALPRSLSGRSATMSRPTSRPLSTSPRRTSPAGPSRV